MAGDFKRVPSGRPIDRCDRNLQLLSSDCYDHKLISIVIVRRRNVELAFSIVRSKI